MALPASTRLLAVACTTALALAQQKVVPAGMDFVEGPLVYTYPFGRADAAIQLLYDADQITLGQGVVLGMRFRQSQVTAAQTHPGYTKNYKVTAYTVAAMAATMSPDPAVNIGTATGTVVFQGPVVLPPIAVLTTQPAPFTIHLPFPSPYLYDGALGNLLFVVETDDLTAVQSGYRIDAVNFSSSQITGLASNLDTQGCLANNQYLSLSTNAAQAIVGGSLLQTVTSSAQGAFPVAMAALSLGVQPTDMAPFGMPGCTLWLAPFALQFTLENAGGGYPAVSWALPNAPWIEGIAMASQALGLAPSGLLSESVVSNGVGTRIGSSSAPVMRIGMSFRAGTTWSMGQNGTFVTIVALEGVFP